MNQPHETTFEGNTTKVTFDVAGIKGVGVARCRPDDAFSRKTGELIALGRAMQDVGRQVEEAGDALVVTTADLEKALRLIDEVADEEGSTSMAVGSGVEALIEERKAEEEDEIVNRFIGMLLGSQLQESAETAVPGKPRCGCPYCC